MATMATIPPALRDEVDASHPVIPIDHIKIPGKKNQGFLEFLGKKNIKQFANELQQINLHLSLSREEIATCWVARLSGLWTVFEYQSDPQDVEIHRPKFLEALLQPENIPFYTRAELYIDRMMNPGINDSELAKKRDAERQIENGMQDSLSLMLDDINVNKRAPSGSEGGGVGKEHFTEKHRELLNRYERYRKQNAGQVILDHIDVSALEKDRIERTEERKKLKRKQFGDLQQIQQQRREQKRKTKKERQRLKLSMEERDVDGMDLDDPDDPVCKVESLMDESSSKKQNR